MRISRVQIQNFRNFHKLDIALSDHAVVVGMCTLPERNASTRILEKLGMSFVGFANDADEGPAWRWELTRRTGSC